VSVGVNPQRLRVWRGFNSRTFLFGFSGSFDGRLDVALLKSTPMSPLWLSAHARSFYSLIRELFYCEAMGIFKLDKLTKKMIKCSQ